MALRPRLNLLIACTVLLAMQFIVPPAARAGHGAPMTELGLPLAEDAFDDTDPEGPLGSGGALFLAFLPEHWSGGPTGTGAIDADRPGCALLLVAGLQPSAP
ncbi:MAG TPA: hypothetical protein PLH93_04955 [Flavobacteriales bacterium]|nr:hypothetical protein [Flavobacteriales bacterium]HQW86511.1 hypothetical protein [Flavobacteriales bacterium]